MKRIPVLSVMLLACELIIAQSITETNKSGWLVYYGDKVFWVESSSNKSSVDNKCFFKQKQYLNGLIVNYMPEALYYKSVAKSYVIHVLQIDTNTKKTDYSIRDSIWIVPAKVKFKNINNPVSESLVPMGLSIKKNRKETTMQYNFETNYDIEGVELLRAADRKKLKRVKSYQVYPPH